MAATIASEIAHMNEPRLRDRVDDDEQNGLIAGVLEPALRSGELSVARGPELLPVLREAGVVDAGGYGLTVMLAGVIAALRGSAPPELAHHAPARITHPQHESSTYRYCTNFAVTGESLEPDAWNDPLERLGDSVLVVGDSHTLKVHLHTDEPERATRLFEGAGDVSHLDLADMTEQVQERTERLAEAMQSCGVLSVVAGSGLRALFGGLCAVVLDGGDTLNPSTYELLAGIHDVAAEEVVVLPNSPNVIMAAERAAELAEKTVIVFPSRSMQAGLAAAVALDPARSAVENAVAMEAALEHVRTGAVTRAARDDAEGRFRRGEAVGLFEERLGSWGGPEESAQARLPGL